MQTTLTHWRRRWTAAGVPTIPLRPGAKAPMCKGWDVRPTADQWGEVGSDFVGNIGTVMGGGIAVVDCDTPETYTYMRNWLEGCGLDPDVFPTVQTQSGSGRHIYLKTKNTPTDKHAALLAIGSGELRFGRGAYVVAPSSQIGRRRYHFVSSYPEALQKLRPIKWRELQPLITSSPSLDLEFPPVRLVRRALPQATERLLVKLARTEGPTSPFLNYASRSEAEAAVIAVAILTGWTFTEIADLFIEEQPGHFNEHNKPAYYLRLTYRRVLSAIGSAPTRQAIALMYNNAANAPWPGRSGSTDRAVYLAVLATAWAWDSWTVQASLRHLAEHAACGRSTVSRALKRLRSQGHTQLVDIAPNDAHVYQINVSDAHKWDNSHSGGGVSGDEAFVRGEAELWARERLGQVAAQVLGVLGRQGRGVRELGELTGRSRGAVSAALRQLRAWDLADTQHGGRWPVWVRGSGGLELPAEDLNCELHAARRRDQHERERLAYQERKARAQGGG